MSASERQTAALGKAGAHPAEQDSASLEADEQRAHATHISQQATPGAVEATQQGQSEQHRQQACHRGADLGQDSAELRHDEPKKIRTRRKTPFLVIPN